LTRHRYPDRPHQKERPAGRSAQSSRQPSAGSPVPRIACRTQQEPTRMTYPAAAGNDDHPTWNLPQRQKVEILGAILLALFLFALDQTVVGTALPIISTKLNGASLYTWAFTLYLLTSTISGPVYGKLSDLYGRRPIFIWAVGLFLAASVLAGLSQEMWQFILARGLQGLGGGAVFPI